MGWGKRVAAGIVTLLLLVALVAGGVAGAYAAGVIERPSVSVVDAGDWTAVTEEQTGIVTTLRVRNPNPVGLTIGPGVGVTYRIAMNGVTVATGRKDRVAIAPGNDTVALRTNITNRKLEAWWVAFVQANETVRLRAVATVEIDALVIHETIPIPPIERTFLAGQRPVSDALSGAASAFEGDYTTERTLEVAGATRNVTLGYEIRQATAAWGEVSRNETRVRFRFRVHNPGAVPEPAVPENVAVGLSMNGVDLIGASGEGATVRSPGDATLEPGETQTLVVVATLDNRRIDEWFETHVRRGEHTDVEVSMRMTFESERLGTVSLPREGPVVYTCQVETGMLVDNATPETTCRA